MLHSRVPRPLVRLLLFTALISLALLAMARLDTQATEIPLAGSPVFIQTTGPNAPLGVGDFYTNVAGGNDPHTIEINVPCDWPTATPLTFALFDPEVNEDQFVPVSPAALDEIRDAGNNITYDLNDADDTTFTLTAPGGVNLTQNYTPTGGTHGLWVELVTFLPETPGFGCGVYRLDVSTADNDDNAWRLKASHDPDCDVTPSICTGVGAPQSALLDDGDETDDPDTVPGSGDELTIGLLETSFQNLSLACQDFYFFVGGGLSPIGLHNFDLDAGFDPDASVTYYPPITSSYAPSQTGTVSGFTVWNNVGGGPPPRGDGDLFAIAPEDVGWWRAEICVNDQNQYIFEGETGEPIYFQQPPTPVMTVIKDDGVSVTGPNDVLTYTITFTNTSDTTPTPGAAINVVLTDTLPTNTTFQSCAINPPLTGTCVESAGLVTFAINETVAAGDSGSVRVTVQVNPDPGGAGLVTNTVTLNYQDLLGNPYPPETDDDVDTIPLDLQIKKRDGGETSLSVGQVVTFTLVYTNVSTTDATGVVITETVPVSTTFNAGASLPTVWSCPDGAPAGTVCVHNVGDVAGGASGVVTFAVTISDNTLFIVNTVWIGDDGSHGPDPTPEDNTDTIGTPAGTLPDLQLAKTDGGVTTVPGGTVVYTLTYTNTGQLDASGVTITDTVPQDTTFNAAASLPTVWSCPDNAPAGAICTTVVGTVAGNGGTGSVTFAVTVDDPLPPGVDTIFNAALISDDGTWGPDPTPEDNTDTDTTPVLLPGIELSKHVSPGTVVFGMPFTYTIRITNTGQVPLDPLVLTDTLPAGPPDFHYIVGSGTPTDPDIIAEPLLVWNNLGLLAPGGRISVTFAVTVTPGGVGAYLNTAVTEGTHPGGVVTDTDDAAVSIVNPALVLDKRLVAYDQDRRVPNYVTFTIAVTNVGPSTLDVVPMLDTFDPYYLSYRGGTPRADGSASAGEISWSDLTAPPPFGFGVDLAPNQSFLVTTVFTIVNDITTTINTVTVTGAVDVYDNPADPDSDDEPILNVPTAVELLYLRALGQATGVLVEWATLFEVDSYGFWLYRAPLSDWTQAEKLTFVSSQGGAGGAEYAYLDKEVTLGQNYWYWLMEVDNEGQQTRYGPVSAAAGVLDASWHHVYLPILFQR